MALNRHHKRASYVLGGTAVLVVVFGVLTGWVHQVTAWHGIYCTTGFATTAGCDLPMRTAPQYVMAWLSMILMVPLWSSVFAFLTTGLMADHIDGKSGGST